MNNHPEYIIEDHSGDFVKENQDEYLNSEINPLTYKIIGAACADFIIEDKVILEVKAQNLIIEENSKQLINYLAVSNCRIGLLINFGETTLRYKRFILTK